MDKILKKTKNDPILIVTSRSGFGVSGSIINFIESDSKLKFELNQEQAQKRGLVVADQLKNLAVVI